MTLVKAGLQMKYMKFVRTAAGSLIMAVLFVGCSEVVSGDAKMVRINTGDFGAIAPGTREWLSLLKAREHCAQFSKDAEIADLQESVATYKCIPKK